MQVKTLSSHKAVINDICFDEQADFVASCSDDGSVSVSTPGTTGLSMKRNNTPERWLLLQISGLYTEEVAVFQYGRPVKVCLLQTKVHGCRK